MNQLFNTLAAEHRPMVLAYLRSLGVDSNLAEDLTQDTFLSAYKAFDSFENDNLGAWLRKIAKNKALAHWRAASVRPPLSSEPWVVEGIEEVFGVYDQHAEESDWWNGRREILNGCIGKLGENLRIAIDHIYFRGSSLNEAAEALGSTRLAIGQRLSRARTQIRQCVVLKLNHRNK